MKTTQETNNMTEDEKYMRRAIQLAKCGEASVAPNPMVGAVIVKEGRIIGEGFHRKYGGPHAEVNAVRSVRIPGGNEAYSVGKNSIPQEVRQYFSDCTMFVTLEPCSHWGKTPPCCDMIIEHGFKRVVIGMQDPNGKVNGEGIRRMQDAGIEVKTGVLEDECRNINPYVHTFHSKHRPWVTLKWAQMSDGTMGYNTESNRRLRISTPFTEMLVHRLRSRCQAIMVGTNTAIQDNPSLTTRLWQVQSPLRITIDRKGRLNGSEKLLSDGQETLLYRNEILSEILYDLHKRNVQHLMVEGGSKLLQSFIDANLWDEARVEIQMDNIQNASHMPATEKVLAPVPANAKLCEEYMVDGNNLLILLNSMHI
jgi:diaminohydroxyphosphoribosylaminopyrimidine deaminase/5-amino-6-(5-phosphoribosylamino)uracil reductase